MANGTPVLNPGWQDIQGMFSQFASNMAWRLNLNDYDDVKANAQTILLRISTPGDMPPPPFPALTDAQVITFKTWVDHGCPQNPLPAPPAPAPAVRPNPPATLFRFG